MLIILNEPQQSAEQRVWYRLKTNKELVESVAEQLRHIFHKVVTYQELETKNAPSILVDILASSKSGQTIVFVVRKVLADSTLLHSTYPSIAAFKNELRYSLIKPPPSLGVLVIGQVGDPVQALFDQYQIPLVSISTDISETKKRLQNTFGRCGIKVSDLDAEELVRRESPSEIAKSTPAASTKKEKRFQVMEWLLDLIDWWNTRDLVILTILLLITLGGIRFINGHLSWMADVAHVLGGVVLVLIVVKETRNDMRRKQSCLNPLLVIEREERKLIIRRDAWYLERHIVLKARHNVESYRFRVEWTGSKDVIVECEGEGEIVSNQEFLTRREALTWCLWELKFKEPMRRGEIQTVVLKYTMPDPKHTAQPYHFIAYQHVWKCREFKCRLCLEEGIHPKAVYFVKGAEQFALAPVPDSSEYEVYERPTVGTKYHIEWDVSNN